MIIIKTPQELQLMRESNRLVAEALQELKKLVVAGITTEELDRFAEDFIRRRGAQPAFKGYRGYPASLCVSVNEEIVHGIPSKKKLRDGDIVSLDLGVLMNGLTMMNMPYFWQDFIKGCVLVAALAFTFGLSKRGP